MVRPVRETTDSQVISSIQSCLYQSLGSWVPQTGSLGPATRRAIAMFQSRRNLPASGVLDARTLSEIQNSCGGVSHEVSTASPDWTITHSGTGPFILVFPKAMDRPSVVKLLFLDGKLPAAFRLEQDPQSKGTRWLLYLPPGMGAFDTAYTRNYTKKLGDAIAQAVMDNVVSLTPEESDAARERERLHNEAVSKIYVSFLGMTVGQAMKTYPDGWFEKNGYFVWIGLTSDRTRSLQAVEVSKTNEIFNRDMRYYLTKGMSIADAQRTFSDSWDQNLRMLIVGMFGA